MTGHVEMQDLASSMLYYEETIQELEGQRGHREEIHGHDHLAMIGEESEPAFGWIAAVPRASQISGYRALRDLEADLQELAMDLRRSPSRVFHCQTTNQGYELLADFRSTAGWS